MSAQENRKGLDAFIFGAGSQGRVVLDILRMDDSWSSIQFLDDNKSVAGTTVNGAAVLGDLSVLDGRDPNSYGVIVAMGYPYLRERIFSQLQKDGVNIINAIHPSVSIAPTAKLGTGNMICAGAVVNTSAVIGNSTIINPTSVVEHDAVIGDFVTLAAGAQVGARVKIGRVSFLGISATVLPGVKIGEGVIIGVCTCVLKDVPDNVFALGSPARVIENVGPDFDYSRIL